MKKSLLLIILLFSVTGYSQITKVEKPLKIVKVAPMGMLYVQVDHYVDEVVITFLDCKYQEINVFESFTLNNENFEELSKLLLNSENKEGDEYSLPSLNNGKLYITYRKGFGVTYPYITYLNNVGTLSVVRYLTKNQLTKLFSK